MRSLSSNPRGGFSVAARGSTVRTSAEDAAVTRVLRLVQKTLKTRRRFSNKALRRSSIASFLGNK
jgi:hypothetical protein